MCALPISRKDRSHDHSYLTECGWSIVSIETLAAALAATDPTTPFEYDLLAGPVIALRSREARDRAALILSALDRA